VRLRAFGFILALGILSAPGVERLGPFVLGPAGQYRVTVVANYGEPSDKSQDAEKTLTSWGIQDAKGVRLFHEVVDPERHREEFASINVIERVMVLVGQRGRFLLVELSSLPSAPSGSAIYYVFGFNRAGRFRRVARLVQNGEGLRNRPAPDGQIRLAEGRYLELGVWTSWFEMTFRYEYDERREEFVPQNRCSAVREFQVVPERIEERVVRQDNIITLYRQPDARAPTERIAVTPALKVRPLQACVGGAPGHVHVGEGRLFLQIRIDGKEGWVREPDFFRLGLEQAG